MESARFVTALAVASALFLPLDASSKSREVSEPETDVTDSWQRPSPPGPDVAVVTTDLSRPKMTAPRIVPRDREIDWQDAYARCCDALDRIQSDLADMCRPGMGGPDFLERVRRRDKAEGLFRHRPDLPNACR